MVYELDLNEILTKNIFIVGLLYATLLVVTVHINKTDSIPS